MPNVLMVLTSHDRLGNTGHPTGFWVEEFAAPYYVLADAGVTLTLADRADGLALTLTDEDGLSVTREIALTLEAARDGDKALASLHEHLGKLGNTLFVARDIQLQLRQPWFIPASVLNGLRRDAVAALEALIAKPPVRKLP